MTTPHCVDGPFSITENTTKYASQDFLDIAKRLDQELSTKVARKHSSLSISYMSAPNRRVVLGGGRGGVEYTSVVNLCPERYDAKQHDVAIVRPLHLPISDLEKIASANEEVQVVPRAVVRDVVVRIASALYDLVDSDFLSVGFSRHVLLLGASKYEARLTPLFQQEIHRVVDQSRVRILDAPEVNVAAVTKARSKRRALEKLKHLDVERSRVLRRLTLEADALVDLLVQMKKLEDKLRKHQSVYPAAPKYTPDVYALAHKIELAEAALECFQSKEGETS